MPEIKVDPDVLAAGGSRQLGAAGEMTGVAGELASTIATAADAIGDGGSGGAVGEWGGSWSRSLAMLGDSAARTGGNLDMAGAAYRQTDESQMQR